jgi:hypothetical protein
MSKQPPQRPMTDRPVPNNWLRDFYDYVRSLELRGDLATTTVSRDRTGTVVRAPFATAGGQGASDAQEPPVIVEITGDNDDGSYNATEVRVDSSSLDNFATPSGDYFTLDSGNNGVLYEINGRSGVATGTHVIAVLLPDSNTGSVRWYFDATTDQYGFGGISGGTSGGAGTVGAWVEITSDSAPYSWKQLDPGGADATPAITGGSLYDVNDRAGIPSGSRVWAWYDSVGDKYLCEYHGADAGTKTVMDDGSSTSAYTDDWDRDDQGTDRGVDQQLVTRLVYDTSSDELLVFSRDAYHDANGHLVFYTTESKDIIGTVAGSTNTTPYKNCDTDAVVARFDTADIPTHDYCYVYDGSDFIKCYRDTASAGAATSPAPCVVKEASDPGSCGALDIPAFNDSFDDSSLDSCRFTETTQFNGALAETTSLLFSGHSNSNTSLARIQSEAPITGDFTAFYNFSNLTGFTASGGNSGAFYAIYFRITISGTEYLVGVGDLKTAFPLLTTNQGIWYSTGGSDTNHTTSIPSSGKLTFTRTGSTLVAKIDTTQIFSVTATTSDPSNFRLDLQTRTLSSGDVSSFTATDYDVS